MRTKSTDNLVLLKIRKAKFKRPTLHKRFLDKSHSLVDFKPKDEMLIIGKQNSMKNSETTFTFGSYFKQRRNENENLGKTFSPRRNTNSLSLKTIDST